mgnify:CR=1 FL=1
MIESKDMVATKNLAGTLILAFSMVFLAACGSQANVALSSKTENTKINLTLGQKSSLLEMESEIFNDLSSYDNCAFENSPHLWTIQSLIDSLNGVLHELHGIEPGVHSAELLEYPPRDENSVAVYLCDDLRYTAYSLHMSVFISSRFLDDLQAESARQGAGNAFESAAGFVLYHELGHAMLGHSSLKLQNTDDERTFSNYFDFPQEIEADRFAYDALMRSGIGVDGIELAMQTGSRP